MNRKRRKTKTGRRSFLTLWVFLVPVLAIVSVLYLTNQRSNTSAIGGPFTMQAADGVVITEDILTQKSVTFVFFGYTACPDICPTSLSTLAAALDALPVDKQRQTQTIFVSVDPERDKGADPDDYAKLFHPTFLGVTGTREEIDKMVAAYKAYYKIAMSEEGDIPLVDHTALFYLMGQNGRYITHFGTEASPKEIQQKLQEIL